MTLASRRTLIVAALAALCLAGPATAAGGSVSLKLKGEYAKRHARACGKAEDFRLYHGGSTVEFKGVVAPAPAGHFAVRLEVKRCVRGHWRKVTGYGAIGKKLTGKYKGSFGVRGFAPRSRRGRTYLVARAIVGTAHSRKIYFAVTR